MTPDLVCIAGRDGFFKKVNRAVIEKFGYTEEELMTRPIASFMHPEDKQLTLQKRSELFQGKSLVNFRNRYVTKSGNTLWLEWTSLYFPEESVVFAIAKDITKRRQVEQEIEEDYRDQERAQCTTIRVDFEPASLDRFLIELRQVEIEHRGTAVLVTQAV